MSQEPAEGSSGLCRSLAKQLRRGWKAVACVAQLSNAIITELIAQAGFELIIVDHENGPGDFDSAANLVRSAVGAGAHVMLRLPSGDATQVDRALDAGAEGLLLGDVATAAEAEAFGQLVQQVVLTRAKTTGSEWLSSPREPPEPSAPLVAVEMDVTQPLTLAEELLAAEHVDLVFVDPERCLEALASLRPESSLDATSSRLPVATLPADPTDGEADTKTVEEPTEPSDLTQTWSPSAPSGSPDPRNPRAAKGARKVPSGPTQRLANTMQVAEAMDAFWNCFEALPAKAAEKQKLVGCTAHARTSTYDLFMRGHSVVTLCADLVLLREGSQRHVSEMKMDRGPESRHWATALESQRARLASSALVSQLRRHKKALGAFLHLGDALEAETLCLAGFEAVVLDHEEGPGNLSNAICLVHAAASAGTHTLLRVPSHDFPYLRRALQLGLEGLILPMAESAAQVEDFIAAVRKSYPSSSLRGAGGHASVVRSVAPTAAQFLWKREELLLKAVQVESEIGLAHVRDMVKVEGLDMIFFAPVELAASAPRGQEAGLLLALQTAEAEVKRAKKLLGGMLVPGRSVETMFAAGYDLVCTTSDVILLRATAENIVREAKPFATGPTAGQLQWISSAREAKFAKDEETLVMRLKKSPQARALAVMSRLGSALAAELVAEKGFEVVILDHAKGAEDLLGAMAVIHATVRCGAHALLRLPAFSLGHLRRALHVGVEGVIFPVHSLEDAHAMVELCLYPSRNLPEETKLAEARMKNQPFRRMDFSFAPSLVEFWGQRVAEFSRRQAESLLIAAQVDSSGAAACIEDIVKVEGLDMIFIDASNGLAANEVEAIQKAAKGKKLLGGLLPGRKAEELFRGGYQLVCAASDHGLRAEGAKACIAERPK